MEEERNQEELIREQVEEKAITKEWATPLKANKKGGNNTDSTQLFQEEQANIKEDLSGAKISFLEAIGGVFIQPAATFKEIGSRGYFSWGIIIALLIFLINAVLGVALVGKDFISPFETIYAPTSLAVFYLAFLPLGIGLSVTYASVLYALAALFGGRGCFQGFFAAIMLAALPMVFISLLQPLFKTEFLNLFFSLLKLAIFIWVLVLQIYAIRESLTLTTGKATLVYFLPLIFLFGSIIWMLIFGMFAFPGWGGFLY